MRYNNQNILTAGSQMLGIKELGGLTLREYQLRLLDILKEVKRICVKHNIQFYLMYGTLIGAVRHHGFIPWDDDVDIALISDEFQKFKQICSTELDSKYEFISYDTDDRHAYTFARIREKGSTYIITSEVSRHGTPAGFYIDIMTLYPLSPFNILAELQKRALLVLHRLVSPGFSQGAVHLTIFEDFALKIIKSIFGKRLALSLTKKILNFSDGHNSKYVISNLILGNRLSFSLFEKKHFEKTEYMPFESSEMPVPYEAISLITYAYCKNNYFNNIQIEANYANQAEAIRSGCLHRYTDIFFIPQDRNRRHQEVIFDANNNSTIYDKVIFSVFDRSENDLCAISERKCQEKAAKHLKLMNENSINAALACTKLRLVEFIEKYMNNTELDQKEIVHICSVLIDAKEVLYFHDIEMNVFVFCIKSLIRCGYLSMALRLLQKAEYLASQTNNAKDGKQLEQVKTIVLDNIEAYYALFEGNQETIARYLQKYDTERYMMAKQLYAINLYQNDNTQKRAKELLLEVIALDENHFLAQFFLGEIAREFEHDLPLAEKYYRAAMDSTAYMPLIQMAIDRLKELQTGTMPKEPCR